jgi:hypothetical protein
MMNISYLSHSRKHIVTGESWTLRAEKLQETLCLRASPWLGLLDF